MLPKRTILVGVVGITRLASAASASGPGRSLSWGIALASPRGGLVNRLGGRLWLAIGIEFRVVAYGQA